MVWMAKDSESHNMHLTLFCLLFVTILYLQNLIKDELCDLNCVVS